MNEYTLIFYLENITTTTVSTISQLCTGRVQPLNTGVKIYTSELRHEFKIGDDNKEDELHYWKN